MQCATFGACAIDWSPLIQIHITFPNLPVSFSLKHNYTSCPLIHLPLLTPLLFIFNPLSCRNILFGLFFNSVGVSSAFILVVFETAFVALSSCNYTCFYSPQYYSNTLLHVYHSLLILRPSPLLFTTPLLSPLFRQPFSYHTPP